METPPFKITVAPAPDGWQAEYPCGCSLETGRCAVHVLMMQAIHTAWYEGPADKLPAIWAASNGYGTPGYKPDQGYDWSGIRDSTPRAIHRMFEAAVGL